MSFTAHTPEEIKSMLARIGVTDINTLFDEIPQALLCQLPTLPGEALNEMEMMRLLSSYAEQDKSELCFIGAGAYEHHIPAAVWDITSRGEFLTAYTPYQPEASQGTLQLLYEYQTMMASLTGLDVSNASLYDGASALAEAILMAVRIHEQGRKIILARSLSPFYRETVKTIIQQQGIEIIELPYTEQGVSDIQFLESIKSKEIAALVIPQPNFFGCLEDVDALSAWAKKNNCLSIAVVNPTSLAILQSPGEWGADIACGEGQPCGIPLASGGPYFGFLCCKKEFVRQMPGRIVGRTVDKEGKPGFVLTLQAREQHIRRSKATSNICTNQSLLVTAATIYLSLLGVEGLKRVAIASHHQTRELLNLLTSIPGITQRFHSPFFHEIVLQLPSDSKAILKKLLQQGIQGGLDLSDYYPELKNCILVCATETKTKEDLERYYLALK